jgi:hypothetical protein
MLRKIRLFIIICFLSLYNYLLVFLQIYVWMRTCSSQMCLQTCVCWKTEVSRLLQITRKSSDRMWWTQACPYKELPHSGTGFGSVLTWPASAQIAILVTKERNNCNDTRDKIDANKAAFFLDHDYLVRRKNNMDRIGFLGNIPFSFFLVAPTHTWSMLPLLEHRAEFPQFLDQGQSVGLLGRVISSSQGLYLYTNTEKRTHIHRH